MTGKELAAALDTLTPEQRDMDVLIDVGNHLVTCDYFTIEIDEDGTWLVLS